MCNNICNTARSNAYIEHYSVRYSTLDSVQTFKGNVGVIPNGPSVHIYRVPCVINNDTFRTFIRSTKTVCFESS